MKDMKDIKNFINESKSNYNKVLSIIKKFIKEETLYRLEDLVFEEDKEQQFNGGLYISLKDNKFLDELKNLYKKLKYTFYEEKNNILKCSVVFQDTKNKIYLYGLQLS